MSNGEDFDRVDAVRATCDAILVGANTIRRDNPRLLVRSARRVEEHLAAGLPGSPIKVTVTNGTGLDPASNFFTSGDTGKVVDTSTRNEAPARERLGEVATVVAVGDSFDPVVMLADLARRGVRRLMVEGGTGMHTLFLTHGLADEQHRVVAPFLIGDPAAPYFTGPGAYPQSLAVPARLLEIRSIGDCVLLRFALSGRAFDA